MSDTSAILLADAEASLRRAVESAKGNNTLEEAFAGCCVALVSHEFTLSSLLSKDARLGAVPEALLPAGSSPMGRPSMSSMGVTPASGSLLKMPNFSESAPTSLPPM